MDSNKTTGSIQVNQDEKLLEIASGLKKNFEAAMQIDLSAYSQEAVRQYVETMAPIVKQFSFYLIDVMNAGFKTPKY